MFLGHLAVGFAAKRLAPSTSLGTLFAACEWIDLVWPAFLLAGWEQVRVHPGDTAFTPLEFVSYPLTHSLLMAAAWAVAFAVVYALRTRKTRAALVCGGVVLSHWFLDWLTHRPDLPLIPGGRKFGAGLWNSVPATLILELTMFAAGVVAYTRMTRARDRKGAFGLIALVGFLAAVYAANVFGPPPPDESSVAWASLSLWLLPFWAAWADRHRESAR